MARNIAQRLDRLERLAAALLNQGPVYCREGEEQDGAIIIRRVFIDPPLRDEEPLSSNEPEPLPNPSEATAQQLRAWRQWHGPLEQRVLGII
jgi:hypothetical protein